MDRKQINERMVAFQQSTIFPAHLLPQQFDQWKSLALYHSNPVTTKLSISEYRTMITKDADFTVFELGYMLHAMEIRTAKEMQMAHFEYCDYLEAIEATVKEWRAIVAPMQEQFVKEFEDAQANIAEMERRKAEGNGVGNTIALPKPGEA